MSVAFSNDGSEAIHRNVSVAESCHVENTDWFDTLQIKDSADWINENHHQRVGTTG